MSEEYGGASQCLRAKQSGVGIVEVALSHV